MDMQFATPPATAPAQGVANGFGVSVMSLAQIEQAARDAERAANPEQQRTLDGLSAHINKLWGDAKMARSNIELDILRDMRQREEEYEPDVKAKLATMGGSDLYDNITDKICAGGEAWLKDLLLFQPSERPYDVTPTELPTLPADAMVEVAKAAHDDAAAWIASQGGLVDPAQIDAYAKAMRTALLKVIKDEAKERARKMMAKINDIIDESRFNSALSTFLTDFTTHRAGAMELTIQKVKEPDFRQVDGITIAETRETEKPIVEWFSLFDLYPSNDATSTQNGYLFRRFWPSRTDIQGMKGMDKDSGYNDAAIDEALKYWKPGAGSNTAQTDGERARLEGKQNTLNPHGDSTEALKFWGRVQGKLINEWRRSGSMDEQEGVADPSSEFKDDYEYEVMGIVIGGKCIKAKLNPDPMGRRWVYVSSWRKTPGAFFGKGIARLVRKCQIMCNTLCRAIANNVGFAGLPIMGVDVSKLPEGMSVSKLYPGQVIQFANRDGQTGKILEFWQAQLLAGPLDALLQQEYRRAEDAAGVPPYQYGSEQAAGAGRTASGLSMLMQSSSRGIKMAIGNIDEDVIKPMIRDIWVYVMLFDPDEDCKGDVNVVARGALGNFVKEQVTLRRLDLMNATNNPMDAQIKGVLGRAKELREAYKSVNVDPDGIIPEDDDIKAKIAAEGAAPAGGAPMPGSPGVPMQPPTPVEQPVTPIPEASSR